MKTCGWMWNDTGSGTPGSLALYSAAWENCETKPPQLTTGTAQARHLQPQAHAKYNSVVIVFHYVLQRGTKTHGGAKE